MSTAEGMEKKRGWTFQRYMLVAGIVLGIIILLPLIIGVLVAIFADPEPTAVRFGMIRDMMLVILAMQGVLVILSLAILILQIARMIALLQGEIKPILDDTKEAALTAKGTTQFVSKNVVQPVVSTRAFLTGLTVFVRELIGIRRALRSEKHGNAQ